MRLRKQVERAIKGGKGSGNHKHKGRPGEQGGSASSDESSERDEVARMFPDYSPLQINHRLAINELNRRRDKLFANPNISQGDRNAEDRYIETQISRHIREIERNGAKRTKSPPVKLVQGDGKEFYVLYSPKTKKWGAYAFADDNPDGSNDKPLETGNREEAERHISKIFRRRLNEEFWRLAREREESSQ